MSSVKPSAKYLMKISHLALSLAIAGCVTGAEVPRVITLSVGQWPEDLVFDPASATSSSLTRGARQSLS
jgi:hypothetical protein